MSVGVDINFDLLSGTNVRHLRLFQIRRYPNLIEWHEIEHCLSNGKLLTWLDGALGYSRVHGSTELGIAEVQQRLVQGRLRLLHICERRLVIGFPYSGLQLL